MAGEDQAGGVWPDIRADFIPARDYVDPAWPKMERSKLWTRTWQVACREEEVPELGDFVNYRVADESIIIIRSAPDTVRAFFNVCRHRGRRLVDAERGNLGAGGFACGFHGWRWRIDGTLAHVTNREDWAGCPDFADDDLALNEPRIDRWAGWIWINMDPAAPPLRDWLGAVAEVGDRFDVAGTRLRWHETLVAPVNWKVFVEAFIEGYHSGATHRARVGYHAMKSPAHVHAPHAMYFAEFSEIPRVKKDGKWVAPSGWPEAFYYQSLELYERLGVLVLEPGMRAATRLMAELPPEAGAEETGRRMLELLREELEAIGAVWPEGLTIDDIFAAGTSWHIFPNSIMLPVVDGVQWYRFRPGDDAEHCVVDVFCLQRTGPDAEHRPVRATTIGFDEFRGRNPFLEEDFDNMIAVNEGMKSVSWRGARTNPVQEATIVNFHRMLRRFVLDTPC